MRVFYVLALVAMSTRGFAAMPAPEQSALVKTYCAVCHTDAASNGGLSLEHYDAARRDPSLAAMILSKLNNGAMGAAGIGVPDKAVQHAWLESTREQAAGATEWFVTREGGVVSASIVRAVPPRRTGSADSPVYRVAVACHATTGAGELRLTWSPEPQTGRRMTASADGKTAVAYNIEGKESMGNGGTAQTGHASVLLSRGKGAELGFASRSLTIRDLFPNEIVEFPFADLDENTRADLRKCF
jgi:hypothetical protein